MTADNLNNPAWLAANADHDRPYEGCLRQSDQTPDGRKRVHEAPH